MVVDAQQVRPLAERDIDAIILASGGRRAHPDANRRRKPGADYILGNTLIELKILEHEGLDKADRQRKLASLFREHEPDRPVIVVGRDRLPEHDRSRFDRIVEGPIKTAVSKARGQLKQSRSELVDVTCSVLLVINNGYTTLDHSALKALVAKRVRNDTSEIDAVIVAGSYYHSDGFESFFLWPIDLEPINLGRPFAEFEQLRKCWGEFAESYMTAMVLAQLDAPLTKLPNADTKFQLGGVCYVKPAPALGQPSDFYVHGRPRANSTGVEVCPPVATTFPRLSESEWKRFQDFLGMPRKLFDSYARWKQEETNALSESAPLKPTVMVPIDFDGWLAWCVSAGVEPTAQSIFTFANGQFDQRVKSLLKTARERRKVQILPSRYVLALTELIGQDQANDVSHLASVRELRAGKPRIRPIVENAHIFHEHALVLAASYAVREGTEAVLWSKDRTYAWI